MTEVTSLTEENEQMQMRKRCFPFPWTCLLCFNGAARPIDILAVITRDRYFSEHEHVPGRSKGFMPFCSLLVASRTALCHHQSHTVVSRRIPGQIRQMDGCHPRMNPFCLWFLAIAIQYSMTPQARITRPDYFLSRQLIEHCTERTDKATLRPGGPAS